MKKILFITFGDSSNIKNWSGTIYNMHNMLLNTGYEVKVIDGIKENKVISICIKIINKFLKKKLLLGREKISLKMYSYLINKKIKKEDFDIIVTPSTLLICYIKTEKPIILYTDATFSNMLGYYSQFKNICEKSIVQANFHEKLALTNANICVFSSKWAVEEAANFYNIDRNKLKEVSFGVNVEVSLNKQAIIENIIQKLDNEIVNILFIGVEFERKGGPLAINIVKKMNEMGKKAKLIIVGCTPSIRKEDEEYVKIIGFLNKHNSKEMRILQEILYTAHLFLLPTQAEAFGIAFAEANAYGIPSLGNNTGGVPSVIEHNVNGLLFDNDTSIEEYAHDICLLMNDLDRYKTMCVSAYDTYINKFNWQNNAEIFKGFIDELT